MLAFHLFERAQSSTLALHLLRPPHLAIRPSRYTLTTFEASSYKAT